MFILLSAFVRAEHFFFILSSQLGYTIVGYLHGVSQFLVNKHTAVYRISVNLIPKVNQHEPIHTKKSNISATIETLYRTTPFARYLYIEPLLSTSDRYSNSRQRQPPARYFCLPPRLPLTTFLAQFAWTQQQQNLEVRLMNTNQFKDRAADSAVQVK